MLSGNLLSPKFNNIMFYTEKNNKYTSKWKNHVMLRLFKKYTTLNFLNNFANCPLIIDNSCEGSYNYREFWVCHCRASQKRWFCSKTRNKIYQQSKLSRRVDLNTTHIALFKLAPNFQQIAFFGILLNIIKLQNNAINWQLKNRLGICLSILIQKLPFDYDPSRFLLSQDLQCSLFYLIKQKQSL